MEFVKESAMSSSPISNICLTERQMQLSMDGVERVLIGYALPFVVIFGITGNLFNLTVLLTPSMRSRSNIFLAALAVADMLFLFLMFPHSLVHFDLFLFNYYFRLFYLSGTTYLLTLANWASAAAIWLILTICVERLIGIRYPLSTRKRSNCSIPAIIAVIVFVTGVLTAYNLFSHECVLRVFCNDTQVHGYCLEIAKELWPKNRQNPHSVLRKAYALWSPRFNAVFVVFLPTLVIVMSNALLIQTLHKRRKFLQDSTRNHSEEGQTLAAAGNNAGTNCQSRNEQRITLTICAIVTCFTLTQAPSAFYHLLKITLEPSHGRLPIGTITNFMVCVGKSLNFLLFCMSSSSFRNKFMKLTKNRLNVAMGKKDASKSFTNDTMLTAYTDRSRSPSPNLRIRPTDRKLSAPQPLLKVTPSIKHEPKLSLSSKLPLIKKKSRSLKEFHRLKSVHFNSPKAENRKTDRLDVNVSVI